MTTTTTTTSALGTPRRLIPSPPPRCIKCGTTPTTPDVAELIETDELCPGCRANDLRDSIKEINAAIADLARAALPAMSRGLLPVELEQLVVAYATAAVLATTPAGAALLAELGLAVA